MARRSSALKEKATVVHTFRGTAQDVVKQYHRDVDVMGWQGYVEVTHTVKDIRRGWKAIFLPPQKELAVTYRRLD